MKNLSVFFFTILVGFSLFESKIWGAPADSSSDVREDRSNDPIVLGFEEITKKQGFQGDALKQFDEQLNQLKKNSGFINSSKKTPEQEKSYINAYLGLVRTMDFDKDDKKKSEYTGYIDSVDAYAQVIGKKKTHAHSPSGDESYIEHYKEVLRSYANAMEKYCDVIDSSHKDFREKAKAYYKEVQKALTQSWDSSDNALKIKKFHDDYDVLIAEYHREFFSITWKRSEPQRDASPLAGPQEVVLGGSLTPHLYPPSGACGACSGGPRSSSKVSVGVPDGVRGPSWTVLQEPISREEFMKKGSMSFGALLSEMEKGEGNVIKNKHALFKESQKKTKEALSENLALKKEEIGIYQSPPVNVDSVNQEKPSIQSQAKFLYGRDFMDYSYGRFKHKDGEAIDPSDNQAVTFVDFANYQLGGGWKGPRGFVQEEQMVAQSFDMLNALAGEYSLQAPKMKWQTRTEKSVGAQATPILFENIRFFSNLKKKYLSPNSLEEDPPGEDYLELKKDARSVNVVAVAATELDRSNTNVPYTKDDIADLFLNAYTAFKMVKEKDQSARKETILYTGNWGAGAFGHAWKVSHMVQVLAARLVFDEKDTIVFTGFKNIRLDKVGQQKKEVEEIVTAFSRKEDSAKKIEVLIGSLFTYIETNKILFNYKPSAVPGK